MTSTNADLHDLDAQCALEALRAEGPFVRALAKSLLFDDAQVDDVVQQTWLEALRHEVPQGPARRGWLARVVRSRASNARRGARRQHERERAAARPEAVESPDELLAREEQRRMVVAAVAALPEPYRSTVMLRYFEGHEPRAIARLQGTPLETVHTRLKRARALLRERLDAAHDGDRRAWMLALVPLATARHVARGAVMAKLFGLFALLAAMKPFLVVFAGLALALLVSRVWIDADAPAPEVNGPHLANKLRSVELAPATAPLGDSAPNAARVEVPAAPPPVARDDGLDATQLAALTGRLVEASGVPAAHRRCRLLCLDPVRAHPGGFEPGVASDGAGITALETVTGDDGVFTFAQVPAGQSHALWLAHGSPHAMLRPLGFELPAACTTDLGTLVLEGRGAITGRVVDADGAPIAGALVRALDLPGALLGLAPIDRLAEGGALFCAIPDPARFVARPDGARAYAEAVRKQLSADVPQADADARFAVLPFPRWLDDAWRALPIPSATSDADGRFAIEGLVDGDHALLVHAAGHARSTKARVSVRDAGRRDAGDLQLVRGESLACRVRDDRGVPVANAELRIALRPRVGLTGVLFAEPARRTDAAGLAIFDALPRGEYVVAFRSAAGARWNLEAPVDSGANDSAEEVELTLPARRDVKVRVVDGEGRAVETAEFTLWCGSTLGEATAAGLQEAVSLRAEPVDGEPGRSVLRDLEPDVYTLGVRAPGHAYAQRLLDASSPLADGAELVIELAHGVDCTIEVVDDAGLAVQGAEVFVQASADEAAAFSQSILYSYGGYSAWDRLARGGRRTGADGRVRIAALPRGQAMVLVRHRARGSVGVEVAELGAELRVVLPQPGRIEGTVRRGGAVPAPDSLRVSVGPNANHNGAAFPTSTHGVALRDDGSFVVDGLAPGPWRVVVEDRTSAEDAPVHSIGGLVMGANPTGWSWVEPGSRRATVDVVAGGVARVAIDLDPFVAQPGALGAHVRGRVVIDGVPLAGAGVKARVDDSNFGSEERPFATTDAQGRFERGGVDARELTLIVTLPFTAPVHWSRGIAGTDGATLDAEFVAATAALEVLVLDPDGLPGADCPVWFTGEAGAGGFAHARATTDASGRCRVRLPRGRYELFAEGPRGQVHLSREALDSDSRREARLSDERYLRLRFAVDAAVNLEWANVLGIDPGDPRNVRSTHSVMLGERRECALGQVDAGTYRVELRTRDGVFATDPATITVAERGPAEFVLRLGARREE